jgi:hypothetical protein
LFIFGSSLDRSITPAFYPSPPPLSPLTFAALSLPQPYIQPLHSLHDDGDEDTVTGVLTYVFPANLKTVDVDLSTSSPATSRRGPGPSDHHENN